jgi:hypothetical protein
LVASLGAGAVSLMALQHASEAKELAAAPGPTQANVPAAQQPVKPQQTTAAPKTTSTAPPVLDERTVYDIKYTKQALTLTAGCSSYMYADLDEPRGNVASNGADFWFRGGCNATNPALFGVGDGVDAAIIDNPNATAQECSDRIRKAPLGDTGIPVRQGVAVCLTTSYKSARALGDSWRVVLIVVTGVSDLRTATIEASAWNIPT